jgi:hypothetical protein
MAMEPRQLAMRQMTRLEGSGAEPISEAGTALADVAESMAPGTRLSKNMMIRD